MTRVSGLSALVRLRDEAMFCRAALDSIVEWCDEIVIVTNRCTDATPEIVADFAAGHPRKARVFDYPHEIWPMGPGHDAIPGHDPRASAAFYNFTQDRSTRTHVVKIDGDMVMMDWAGNAIRAGLAAGHDRIRFEGVDLVQDLEHIGCHPRCPTNGVYRVTPATRYRQGPLTQNIAWALPEPTYTVDRPAFVHLKWVKPEASAVAQWPENWRDIEHFQRIYQRRVPVARYDGEYPSALRAALKQGVDA